MKLYFAGKYSGNECDLPSRKHPSCAVKFKEPEASVSFFVLLNILSVVASLACAVIAILRIGGWSAFNQFANEQQLGLLIALILFAISIVPHELLHGTCFKHDVYLYIWLNKGIVFISGVEDMSRSRFIAMNLLPNMVFGFIPFILFMIFPSLIPLGAFAVLSIGMGVGDYVNVVSAFTQVPKTAKVYACGFHTFWYEPSLESEAVDSIKTLEEATKQSSL